MKAFLLSLLTFTTLASGGITTNFEGDVIFDDGFVITNEEIDLEPIEPNEIFCDVGLQISFRGAFDTQRGSQDFCRGFDDFCRVRKFSDKFYEADYRSRHVFRGRGNDRSGGRAKAFSLYFDFINRGRFYGNRFNHQFFFSDNCS